MYVYFVQAGESGPIKIGKTVDIEKRLKGLQSAIWCDLSLLAICVETETLTEGKLHKRFGDLHLRGEWFKPDPELLGFIKSLGSFNRCPDRFSSDILLGMRRVAERDQRLGDRLEQRDIREIIREAFLRAGDKRSVADALGVSRQTLDSWLKHLGGKAYRFLRFEGWEPPVREAQPR